MKRVAKAGALEAIQAHATSPASYGDQPLVASQDPLRCGRPRVTGRGRPGARKRAVETFNVKTLIQNTLAMFGSFIIRVRVEKLILHEKYTSTLFAFLCLKVSVLLASGWYAAWSIGLAQ